MIRIYGLEKAMGKLNDSERAGKFGRSSLKNVSPLWVAGFSDHNKQFFSHSWSSCRPPFGSCSRLYKAGKQQVVLGAQNKTGHTGQSASVLLKISPVVLSEAVSGKRRIAAVHAERVLEQHRKVLLFVSPLRKQHENSCHMWMFFAGF